MANELKKRKTPKSASTVGRGKEATSKAFLYANVLLWIWGTLRFGWLLSPCAQETKSDKKKAELELFYMNVIKNNVQNNADSNYASNHYFNAVFHKPCYLV